MNIAIVEDDSACAEQIATFIRLYSNENKLQLSSTTFSDGVSFLSPYQPVFDLILMDIDMPLVDGLQAAREIREMDSDVGIVFVTALAQYAMAGYEVHALDYMLKPLDYRSFALRMERILRRLEELQRIRTASILIRSRNALRKIHCRDLLYVDVYHNRISRINVSGDRSLRILGIQDNQIRKLDARDLTVCQGIDVGKNELEHLDVSENHELVELYVNDNHLEEIDLSGCPKLKYFYCQNNRIRSLDTTANPLLRHLNHNWVHSPQLAA